MILYSWVNMYLEGIHAGIQTAHVMGEISSKYRTGPYNLRLKMYWDWEQNYKVIQVYNGGYSSSLKQRLTDLETYADKFQLPFASFHESEDALNGALTAIGVVVPSYLYDRVNKDAPSVEGDFWRFLHECKHAR